MVQYDDYKQRLGAMEADLADLAGALDIDAARKEAAELDEQIAAEGFWNDIENSQKVLTRQKGLKNKVEKYEKLLSRHADLVTLVELAIEEDDESLLEEITNEFNSLEQAYSDSRLAALLSGEYDGCNAILAFHAGAGGTEAQDWAQMLYRMYTHWCERKGYKYKVLDYLDGDEAGIKSASILVEGENIFGYLKGEAGIHRLVRVSPFDSSGRRHTSFAAVEVTPEVSEDTSIDIRDEDLKVDTYRSGGAGGQHVNKTESAIRITHIPTGIVVACQNERSQHQNREVAMRMLKSKLMEIKEREHLERIEDIKGEQKLIEWGSQIRSYVFMPYTLVKDNRTDYESGNIGAVMDGDLDGFINAYLSAAATGKLKLK
ncbi:MAG: peptide chain release factor 2 [Clostridia bacterium]|nr:peptide chain release factor 2 [Clostridia bacterium]